MTTRHSFIFLLIFVGFLFGTPAHSDDRPIQQQIPRKITHSPQDKVINLVIENDLFGRGTDEQYTSGVRFTYFDVNADLPYLSRALDDVIPTFDMNDTTSVTYSLGHNIYTPRDISRRDLIRDDRPYAAHLYGSMGLVTLTGNHLDELELSMGVVGPAALGEDIQSFIHQNISNSPDPKGWESQLENEPAIGLAWVRRFPHAQEISFHDISFALTPHFGTTLGNVHTFANAGVSARLSPESEKWQDAPARVRPALPGTGFFETPEKSWSWYVFGGLEGRAVGQNIFLDGNTFRDSHSVDKKYFVYDANAGFAVTYDVYRFSYTIVYRSREFDDQDDASVFGAFSLGYRF